MKKDNKIPNTNQGRNSKNIDMDQYARIEDSGDGEIFFEGTLSQCRDYIFNLYLTQKEIAPAGYLLITFDDIKNPKKQS